MGLKQRLAGAQRRTATHRLRIEDDGAARADLATARASGDEDRITAALDRVDACYEDLRLQAIPLPDWDDLVGKHQPSDEIRRTTGRWCDPVTFLPAALVLCAVGSDADEADWADYICKGAMAPGEAVALLDDLLALHDRSPDQELPKGSTTTPS